ncbi:hypothetical protein CHS0354_030966 [Potamilus streckersoni]|uniref:Uncharacterized protein n=1 Tax=Potamilus streckersoni TaxID=2493646 RepID=A0AAE0VUP3_9BIVA|nr:hypothetical protein CHS0354_030966 [Potamilus streckersoni]
METVFIEQVSHRSPGIPISGWNVYFVNKSSKIEIEQHTRDEAAGNILEQLQSPEIRPANARIQTNDNVCNLRTARGRMPTLEELDFELLTEGIGTRINGDNLKKENKVRCEKEREEKERCRAVENMKQKRIRNRSICARSTLKITN